MSFLWIHALVFSVENSLLKFTDARLNTLELTTGHKYSTEDLLRQFLLTGLTFVQLETPIGIFTILHVEDCDIFPHYVRPAHARLPIEYVEAVEQQLRESNLLVGALCFPTQHAIEQTKVISLK